MKNGINGKKVREMEREREIQGGVGGGGGETKEAKKRRSEA